ncbi:NAD-dependent epimerase/dehydratase family protein [Streptantibioticus rubrisoli]|uniref:NAD-dependent epimerase/dehydratase family protein n=1 Tax=Streptantibioticus rubrisoli TaxID=1387313 RepID=A0ABT1P5E3_9ACTN|nr:NAD-dependent epimerase/dehydratase family protein [Streptantibioticus rubrisoli]MCQ4040598.1 NAD-dependent epimerase/dehydratase family protein [Streptantibioticus rubrisoli]
MTADVFVIGAMGQIGRTAVRVLAEDGWRVRAASLHGQRDETWPDDVEPLALDRTDTEALTAALGDGCDVLVDCVAYGTRDAAQLIGIADRIGSAVVISSAAVYEDERGRGFDTQEEPDGFPRYPVPVPETQRTVAPGERSYATRKAALEGRLLAAGGQLPTTLLRAGAVHGRYNRLPRELYFIQRALDHRPVRVLAYRGESRFHTVHTSNIAELVRLAASRPGSRVLNAGDPHPPTVAEIGSAVDAVLGTVCETVLMDGPATSQNVGGTPWSTPYPMVLDMSAAERELGYRPVTTYLDSLPSTVEWTVRALGDGDWRTVFPRLAGSYPQLFDYAAEDRWLAALRP